MSYAEVDANFNRLMYWSGVWQATDYEANEVVLDDGWLMIANKATTDRAAPHATGPEYNLYNGQLTAQSLLTSQIRFGARFSTADTGVFLNAWRAYLHEGQHYQIYAIFDPLGATPDLQLLADITASTTGWLSVPVGQIVMLPNETLDIIALTDQPDPTPVTWTGNWNYTRPNNDTVPALGDIAHSNKTLSLLRINSIDNDGGDRLAELQALNPGDIIRGAGMAWSIDSSSTLAGVVTFVVTPAQQGTPTGVQEFTFQTVQDTDILYEQDTDYYLTDTQISGLFSSGGADVVADNNAYGIDLTIQDASVSPDWDVLSTTGTSSGTSATDEISLLYKKLAAPLVVTEAGGLVDVMTFTYDDLPDGLYVGTVSFVSEYTAANDQLRWQMTNDLASPQFLKESKDAAESIAFSYTFPIVWLGGQFTTTLQAQIGGPGQADVTIQAANIFLVKERGLEIQ